MLIENLRGEIYLSFLASTLSLSSKVDFLGVYCIALLFVLGSKRAFK